MTGGVLLECLNDFLMRDVLWGRENTAGMAVPQGNPARLNMCGVKANCTKAVAKRAVLRWNRTRADLTALRAGFCRRATLLYPI